VPGLEELSPDDVAWVVATLAPRCAKGQTVGMSEPQPEPIEAPDTTWVETEEIRKDYGHGEPDTRDRLQKRAEDE
jgi:hypothetical protein